MIFTCHKALTLKCSIHWGQAQKRAQSTALQKIGPSAHHALCSVKASDSFRFSPKSRQEKAFAISWREESTFFAARRYTGEYKTVHLPLLKRVPPIASPGTDPLTSFRKDAARWRHTTGEE